ncbi:otopetrin-1-like [Trichogramma pretiosum]|uniref:otopetrin-1-like n=1 Tax=Trichogramma pretiosum TaxID=7493 RepID=UPI0006C9B81D|nr:otopetrin-1-like [Trichogramma pretiosum]
MDQEEARARCLSRPAKRYEIYSNKKRNKEPRQSVRMPRNSSLQPIEESSKNGDSSSNNNNAEHDKDSLNETGSTTGDTVNGGPGNGGGLASSGPGRADRHLDDLPGGRSHSPPPKSLVSRILARSRSPDDLLDHSEPFSQLWIVLSNVYGELVIVLTMALCLAEVMDTPVPLLSLQGIFLMYMYVGSVVVILAIYIWVLVDSCGSMRRGGRRGLGDVELGAASLTRFGSLKLAHISRSRTTPTSFYIRVGALLFGLATLVFNGLEMAMHTMMQGAECLTDVIFVHPVLHGLFTFLQMHFLFVNSQVLVEKFGLAARFGFTHLAATNIAVWVRLVIWDSAQEWTYFVHVAQRGPLTSSSTLNLRGFPESLTRQSINGKFQYQIHQRQAERYEPISQEQISQVVALQECLNTNSLGQLWTSSMPFLYPFIVQFSLIAAAVTFVMGQNVGKSSRALHKKFHSMKDLPSSSRVGCDGSSKGLFLGILCMVAGIVVILIFLVVRDDENFPATTLTCLTCGTLIGILALSGVMTASGLVQIRQMSVVTRSPAQLDSMLSNVALFGVQLYSIFTIVVCACSLFNLPDTGEEINKDIEDMRLRHTMLLATSVLQLLQCFAQSTLIGEASKRCCITRFQILAKPGRQVITFLLFSNTVLWAFDTVITQNWISQELQLRFFGVLAWGIISRIGLPLLIFYRFHSCILLLEAWNKCYRSLKNDHPLN